MRGLSSSYLIQMKTQRVIFTVIYKPHGLQNLIASHAHAGVQINPHALHLHDAILHFVMQPQATHSIHEVGTDGRVHQIIVTPSW